MLRIMTITRAERAELAEDIDTIVAYLEAAVAELADKIHDTCRVGNKRKRAHKLKARKNAYRRSYTAALHEIGIIDSDSYSVRMKVFWRKTREAYVENRCGT